MVSVVTRPKQLQEESDEFIESKLSKYVPMFSTSTDRGAWDLISNLEKIIEFKLYEKLGFDSMEGYAEKYLNHSSAWCDDLIRIYREESAPEATIEEVVNKADRNEEIHRLREVGMTQQAIAEEVGLSRKQVNVICNQNKPKEEKVTQDKNARQFGWMPKSAEDAATKIRNKFGDEFADDLVMRLEADKQYCKERMSGRLESDAA